MMDTTYNSQQCNVLARQISMKYCLERNFSVLDMDRTPDFLRKMLNAGSGKAYFVLKLMQLKVVF